MRIKLLIASLALCSLFTNCAEDDETAIYNQRVAAINAETNAQMQRDYNRYQDYKKFMASAADLMEHATTAAKLDHIDQMVQKRNDYETRRDEQETQSENQRAERRTRLLTRQPQP